MSDYWFVQEFEYGQAKPEAEQPCTDCAHAVRRIKAFRANNQDPNRNMKVHVPNNATGAERIEIEALGVVSG